MNKVYILKLNGTKDSEDLADIHAACFRDHWSFECFRSLMEKTQCFGFIANYEQQDCGFVLCQYVFEESDLLQICVLPEYRRKGIGKALLEEAKTYAQSNGIEKIFLEVAVNNSSAIKLYESAGFQKLFERKGYYRSDESSIDAAVMVCLF
ncbi:N-acetyltransferase GCN5 [Alphaproteobacteria bacterium]|nr:N-acetyltransferase GCN5 [Alphaproteobacteria bacterium]